MRLLVDSHVALWWLDDAQAQLEALTLATADAAFTPYDLDLIDARV